MVPIFVMEGLELSVAMTPCTQVHVTMITSTEHTWKIEINL